MNRHASFFIVCALTSLLTIGCNPQRTHTVLAEQVKESIASQDTTITPEPSEAEAAIDREIRELKIEYLDLMRELRRVNEVRIQQGVDRAANNVDLPFQIAVAELAVESDPAKRIKLLEELVDVTAKLADEIKAKGDFGAVSPDNVISARLGHIQAQIMLLEEKQQTSRDNTAIEQQLRELRTQRRDLLREQLKELLKQVERGLILNSVLIDLHLEVAVAELGVETDPAKRIEILEDCFEATSEGVDILKKIHETGGISKAEVISAQLAHIQAQIMLLEEKKQTSSKNTGAH